MEWRSPGGAAAEPACDAAVDHHHTDDIRTLALSFDEPIDWTRFGIWLTMLLHRHGNELLRVKGIFHLADRQARWRCMRCSIWCTRRGIWAPGLIGSGGRAWYSSPANSIQR